MTGEYEHSIDAKGRMFFPSKLREEIGAVFYVTKGLDNCLFVYSLADWKTIEEKIGMLPMSKSRNLQRTLFASAARCELDGQGRILIPPKLRSYAGLTRDVTVIGASNRAEIWDRQRWFEIEQNELTGDNLADSMDQLGF